MAGLEVAIFGAWDVPIFGELGALTIFGNKVQCHACGEWYRSVGNHSWWTHHLRADEYRIIFGLRASTGLVGPVLRHSQQQRARPILEAYWAAAAQGLRALTPEDRSARLRGRRRPLEAALDPRNRAAWLNNSRLGGQRIRELWASGARQRPQPPQTGWRKALQRWLELLEDPDYRAEFRRKLVAARDGRTQIACGTCHKLFEVARHLARGDRARFCSTECLRSFQRARGYAAADRLPRTVPGTCGRCGAEFTGAPGQLYCSPECARTARNELRRARAARAAADQPRVEGRL